MFRFIFCFLIAATSAHSQTNQFDRDEAILEIEQVLYMMALKNHPPDRAWDEESAAGLTTLRQRFVDAGASEQYKEIMNYDPVTGFDSEAVYLSIKLWNFYNGYAQGRRGMFLIHDGQERLFVQPRNLSQVGH